MRTARLLLVALLLGGLLTSAALADGMIVPVRPELRVRGHWASSTTTSISPSATRWPASPSTSSSSTPAAA